MREASRFLHEVLGYGALETPPAWLMHTVAGHGGLAVGACADALLAGCLFACPARVADRWCLYIQAVAVAPGWRSRGIGGRMMHAARDAARELGYSEMRWTTGILNTPAHLLYLRRCRATLVAHHPQLYAGLLDSIGHPPRAADEVEYRWATGANARPARRGALDLVTRTTEIRSGVRAFASCVPLDGPQRPAVEVPWDAAALEPPLASRWRLGLRPVVRELLASGWHGRDAVVDRVARRVFIVFGPGS